MHNSLRTIAPTIVIVLSLTLTACSATPVTIPATSTSVPSPPPAVTATSQARSTVTTALSPTPKPAPTPSPEPPPVPALSSTATLTQAYPLRLGAQWVYSVTNAKGTPARLVTATGLLTQTVVDESEQNGLLVFRIWSEQDSSLNDFPHNEPIQYYAVSTDAAYWWDSDHPEPLIASGGREGAKVLVWPLKVGQQFSPIGPAPRADGTYAWQVLSEEPVSTPAGHYSDCFHLLFRTNPDDSHAWFCPGTGFMRREYHHHGSIGNVVQVLVGYNYGKVPDKHVTDAAIKATRLRLSQTGQTDPALAAVIAVTPTIWPDACLGLPAVTVCRPTRTPGYLIELEKDQQRYLFRTDADGLLARLAWSSVLPLRDAFVQWRYSSSAGCQMAAIGADQIQYGRCGEALVPASQPPLSARSHGRSQAGDFRQRYRSFIATTPRGTLIFTGTGTLRPSAAEQRAIAEWAAMHYAEADGGYLAADYGRELYWHERSASLCGNLWIYRDGLAVAFDCAGGSVIGEEALAPQELARFYQWLDSGKRWDLEHTPPTGDGQPDATLYLSAHPTSRIVVRQDSEGLMSFARTVNRRLTVEAAEKARLQNPIVVQGRLTVQDGRAVSHRLLVPYDWAGKIAVREEGNLVFCDYDGDPQNWLFVIAAETDAQWQTVQKQPGHGKRLLAKDGVSFVYNTPLANPFTGAQAAEFQRMGRQVQAVLDSLQVTLIR